AYLPLATLYGAVTLAVWFGGYRPAAIAAVIGLLACDYLFIQPRYSFAGREIHDLLGFVLYLLTCAMIIGFGEALRVAHRRAETSRQEALERQKELELESLRRLEAEKAHLRLAAIVESSEDAILSQDLRGNIMSWNQGAQRLLGYSAEEMVGESI